MNETLLKQFMTFEFNDYIYDLMIRTLDGCRNGIPPEFKNFEFNRFEILIDCKKEIVIITDVLDASETGIQEVDFNEFEDTMKEYKK
jgi:hypothetical protein